MARPAQSNTTMSSKDTTAPPTTPEGTPAPTVASETDIDIDIDLFPSEDSTDFAAPSDEDKKMPAAANEATPAAYEEGILDYDDDELIPMTINGVPIAAESAENSINVQADGTEREKPEAEEQVENAETAQATAESHLQNAKLDMIWGAQTMLTQSPDRASALQLNDISDAVSVNVTANGVTYAVTWKVASLVDTEQTEAQTSTTSAAYGTNSLRDAAPLTAFLPAAPQANVKCNFSRRCKNGTVCRSDHTIKPKLCGFVNTSRGCTNAASCKFSHEDDGVNCTRSALWNTCANGRGCAFKHGDDWVREAKEVKVEKKPEAATDAPPANAPSRVKAVKVEGAPKGPKGEGLKQIAGQKHGRDNDEEVGSAPKGPHSTQDGSNNHRGGRQSRGRGRGQDRERGGVGGRPGLRIRGAASKGQV